eukprot:TRINITY_DN31958_c0_g1_i1.p1 TRINITY_DN31958_c0_g1~~TRINITY_DN31958_c0_g1_i1.p1  ORF type:complete len:189 (+),score=33.88 TRINITY_DN31958_c0_g1_i1:92-658(+)
MSRINSKASGVSTEGYSHAGAPVTREKENTLVKQLKAEIASLERELSGQKELVQKTNKRVRTVEDKVRAMENRLQRPMVTLAEGYIDWARGCCPAAAEDTILSYLRSIPFLEGIFHTVVNISNLPEVRSAQDSAISILVAKDLSLLRKMWGFTMLAVAVCWVLTCMALEHTLPKWVRLHREKQYGESE